MPVDQEVFCFYYSNLTLFEYAHNKLANPGLSGKRQNYRHLAGNAIYFIFKPDLRPMHLYMFS